MTYILLNRNGAQADLMTDEFGRDLLAYWLRLNRITARQLGYTIARIA